jgi:hypothetical protein
VNSNKLLVLLLFLIVLAPVGKADGINFPVQPLGNVNATVAITPVEDASMPGGDGFGRISLGYALNGLSNEFVYWIANPLVEPFSASGGQITFIPGNYNYPASSESLNISATLNPTWHTQGGDEFEINNVPVLVSTPVSEPGTIFLLGMGLAAFIVLFAIRRI